MANKKKSSARSASKNEKGPIKYVTKFRHWRSGKIIEAAKYGLKCFPIRPSRN